MKSQPLWSPTPAWRLPICKAPSSTSAWRLSIYKAPTPRHVRGSSSFPHGAPCVHQLPRWQFPHQSDVSKETWLSLISPLEMPDDARRASRSAQRRRSFPSSFTSKFSFLLSFQSTGLLPGLIRQIPAMHTPDDAARRDFACTLARSPDGALRKHSAPPSPTRKNGRHPSRVPDQPQRPRLEIIRPRLDFIVGYTSVSRRFHS